MNHSVQTVKFAIVALAMIGAAVATNFLSAPAEPDWASAIGTEFFPDLEDNNEAVAIRVVGFESETASARIFTVKQDGNLWVIPSHHNYPADGEDRLARTTRSLIGIKRGALVSQLESDHERFGVIDPLDEDNDSLEGRGQRITLYKKDEIAIADLIIGNSVPDRTDEYYVRQFGKDQTYIAALKIDLSTKFRDWVEADLLKMDRDSLTRIESRSAKIVGRQVEESVLAVLNREKFSDPWALDGINEETEEVNKDDLTEMVNTLDNLKLSGIRPKIEGLQADLSLKLPKNIARNRGAVEAFMQMVQRDLGSKGYLVYGDPESDEARLFAEAGELIAGMNTGVQYHMAFGNVFSGDEKEIEIGGTVDGDSADTEKSEQEEDQKPADPPGADDEAADSEDGEAEEADGSTKSRYLFVRTTFNEALLGPAPVKPEKPVPPEGVKVDEDGNVIEPEKPAEEVKPESAETPDADNGDAGDEKNPAVNDDNSDCQDEEKEAPANQDPAAENNEEEGKNDTAAADKGDAEGEDKKADAQEGDDPKAEPEPEPKPDPVEEYKTAISAYRTALSKYEIDVDERADKIKEGKEKVEELNARFAKWYYVISAEDFDKLRLSRDQIVKAKEKPETEEKEGDGEAATGDDKEAAPNAPADGEEKTEADSDTKEPADKKGATEKPAGEKNPDAEEKAAGDTPADESKEEAAEAKPGEVAEDGDAKPDGVSSDDSAAKGSSEE